jgi:hypothetical protein
MLSSPPQRGFVNGTGDMFNVGGERLPNLVGLCRSNKI